MVKANDALQAVLPCSAFLVEKFFVFYFLLDLIPGIGHMIQMGAGKNR